VRVEKYALLSVNDSSGKILDSRPGDGDLTDYARFPNYPLSEHVVIKAGELSPFYPVVYLTITGRVRGHASGCRFTFRQDGVEYRQTLPCGFYFHSL
jgi:hypothetical protein